MNGCHLEGWEAVVSYLVRSAEVDHRAFWQENPGLCGNPGLLTMGLSVPSSLRSSDCFAVRQWDDGIPECGNSVIGAADMFWPAGMVSGDMIRERERRLWEQDERQDMEDAKEKELARDERLKVWSGLMKLLFFVVNKVVHDCSAGVQRCSRSDHLPTPFISLIYSLIYLLQTG